MGSAVYFELSMDSIREEDSGTELNDSISDDENSGSEDHDSGSEDDNSTGTARHSAEDGYLAAIYQYLTGVGQAKYPAGATTNWKRALRRTATSNYRVLNNQLQYRKISKPPVADITTQSSCRQPDPDPWRMVVMEKEQRRNIIHEIHAGALGKCLLNADATIPEWRSLNRSYHYGTGHINTKLSLCISGGHLGRDKTRAKIAARYYWPRMTQKIRDFVKCCDKCQRQNAKDKGVQPPLHPIPVRTAIPWYKVSNTHQCNMHVPFIYEYLIQSVNYMYECNFFQIGMDLIGPLQVTSRGSKYILTCTCYYSKWAEAHPLRAKDAASVAVVLYQIFTRYYKDMLFKMHVGLSMMVGYL